MSYLGRVFETESEIITIPNPVVFSSTVQVVGNVTFDGGTSVGTNLSPDVSDGATLGTSSLMWSDLFLASGAVINFNAGNMTVTHGTGVLTVGGGGLVITGAEAEGILISTSTPTNGVSITAACANGIAISGANTTAGINISGAEVLGISINTSTPTNGIDISSACANAIVISGANTVTGIAITGATATGLAISGACTNDISLQNGATLTNGTAGVLTVTEDKIVLAGIVDITGLPTTVNTPVLGIGNYGTRVVDTSVADSLFLQSAITAVAKDSAGNSSCAGFFSVNNTGATANARLQSVLAHTYLSGDCNDAYGVQGHLTVLDDMDAGGSNYNLIGISGKATLTSGKTVSVGRVTAGLFIVDGAGAVTEECWPLMAHIESTVTAAGGILNLSTGATVNSAIQTSGTTNMTNFIDFDALAGCLVSNALIPATAPDASTVGADAAIVCDVAGTPYYIPLYNSLHA
jgi:hypothetical protein